MQRIRMKWYAIGMALVLVSCAAASAIRVSVSNPSNFERRAETVEINWLKIVSLAPDLTPSNIAVFLGRREISSQLLDSNADGTPDLLLFQVSLRPHERTVLVMRSVAQRRQYAPQVDARFEMPREDVAWESDRIAFRIYGPALAAEVNNGLDVWVKRVRSLIVDKWYTQSAEQKKDTYHEDHGEGADFFSVGRTLGAGSCTIAKGETLYQPGVFTTQRILATGPIRAMFEVTYAKGTIDGVPYREVKTFTIDAGHNLNRIQAAYTGIGNNDSLRVVAGLVKRKNVLPHFDSSACALTLWGPVNDDPVNESLGTGIIVPRENFAGMVEKPDQYLLVSRVPPGDLLVYYAGAGWTRSGDFKTVADWTKMMAQWSRRLRTPVEIRMEKVR
jgi:pectinesterase